MKYKATGMQLYNRGFFVRRSASSVGRSVGPSIGPSVRRLVRLSSVPNMFLRLYRHAILQSRLLRPSVCFVGRSVRQSVGRSVGRSVGWSVSRLCFFCVFFVCPFIQNWYISASTDCLHLVSSLVLRCLFSLDPSPPFVFIPRFQTGM